VTGVPSDDAVLDTILASAGLAPDAVERQTIGFQAVPLLASGRVTAATAFWNAEGVQLTDEGVPTREFRVDEFGAPRYPELVIAAGETPGSPEDVGCRFLYGLREGYRVLGEDPQEALDALLDGVPALDREAEEAQMAALTGAAAFSATAGGEGTETGGAEESADDDLHQQTYGAWARWAAVHGIIETPKAVLTGFKSEVQSGACDS
jgi:ABC-type nitrate/sulfonate/bicarbonate transport system substrate-binding protein